MERLIHSSSVPSKPHLLPSAHLSQFGRLERRNFGFLLPRAVAAKTTTYREHVRVKLFSSERLRRPTCCLSKPTDDPILGLPPLPSACGPPGSRSSPGSQPVGQKSDAGSISQKVLATGKIILLSVLVMIAINPILTTSPALATFQAATQATAGGGKGLFTSEILSSAWTGFFAGCLHTLSGPDHLAALAPLSIGRTRLESAAVGALWGCGHDAGQVIFGLLFLLLKDRLHIEVIRTWGTRVVGLTLLVIGGMGIKEASESVPTPCVALENGECDVSVYESLEKENPVAKKKKKIGFATFATGIVHGLQPDALMMVLPALALPSRVAGAAFLSMFLAGTVVAMGGYTVFIGSCSEALKERVPRITEKLTWASSLVAIGLGFAILVSQFFGFSLY